jgi:flagellar protein FliJ
MKPRESTIQAKEFQATALRRQLAQFDRMIADLEIIKVELGKQIETEERRTGIPDPQNYAYSTIARAARERRRNLSATIADLVERKRRADEQLAELDGFFDALSNAGEMLEIEPRQGQGQQRAVA